MAIHQEADKIQTLKQTLQLSRRDALTGLLTSLTAGASAAMINTVHAQAPVGAKLTYTTAQVETLADRQIIENLDLDYSGVGSAIIVRHVNVIIRHCRIKHRQRHGIEVWGSTCTIEDCEIINAGAPAGVTAENSQNLNNINIDGAAFCTIRDCTLREGSSNIYFHASPDGLVERVMGYNAKGPLPRGQLVQFDKSHRGIVRSFYSKNDLTNSWTEDNVNIYGSQDCEISNGLIDGNNSPTGWGVLIENNSTGAVISDVDCVRMGCGAVHALVPGTKIIRCRILDNYNSDVSGRGAPTSKALCFGASVATVELWDAWVTRPASPNNITWKAKNFNPRQVTRDDSLQPKATPVDVRHSWNS